MKKVTKIIFLAFLFISVATFSQQNKLQHFSVKDGLPSNTVNDIIQDEIGYLWLATDKGLVQFDGNEFKHQTIHSTSKVNSLFYKNKTLFIGHQKGFFKRKNKLFSYLGKEKVLKVIEINNKIILGTTEGIYELKQDYLQPLQIHTKIDFSIVYDITPFKNSIYIATNKGLWSINKLYKPNKVDKILDENIVSLVINKHRLIAATAKKKLKVIDQNKIVKTISINGNITSIKKILDELWITLENNGIEILKLKDYSFKQRINKYNSSISNQINTVFKDNQNTIWIASKNNGLYKFSQTNYLESNNGNPKIFLENITVNYKTLNFVNGTEIELKSTENNISFTYKTIDLQHPKNIKYRYKLKNTYSPWSTQNRVDFANLSSGKYRFKVQSKIEDKISNEEIIVFTIDTPIYKKGWFLIISFTLLFLVLALIVDANIKSLKNKNQQKINKLKLKNHLLSLEQKALQLQMNPHFIFNVLNGIKSLGNSGNTKELNKTISQFSILLRSILNNSRLEEVSLQNEIETLKNYLDLEQKLNSKTFNYSIEKSLNNIDPEEILIPPMLLQPFIENAIKHGIQPISTNGKITILFKVNHRFLECTILDNGIGIHHAKTPDKNHKSVALKVTKERIQNLSKYSAFSIEEIKSKNAVLGTKVWFKIPLKTDY
ncbi:histidine kinase [Polaribacter sp. MSW13]|uniref:Histidine kinase n=1 Tax=Polaribacter marinus TaxID=2916838 RepID=A0A9X2AIR5_9FLAO|nr:sensor histidine kinase [Polaribacter marinus]MCI2228357.1 histidine kinase [Polaribacter marinus]